MATSGSLNTNAYDGRYMQLAWTRTGTNIAANPATSTIHWTLTGAGSASSSWYWAGPFTVVIDGQTVYSGGGRIQLYAGTEVASGDITISHNPDGSRSFSESVSAAIYSSSQNVSGSDSWALDPLPRATTPVIGDVTLGGSIYIDLPRASDNFTHVLSYKLGDASGYILNPDGSSEWPDSATWDAPIDLCAQIPSGVVRNGTLTCKTYSGDTFIGSKSVEFSAIVPSYVVPTISDVAISEAVDGLAAQFGAYVQHKSRLSVSVKASGAYGSTISRCTVSIDNHTYSGSSITTDLLHNNGSLYFEADITDSRGRTSYASRTITVLPYAAPTIGSLSANRITTAGDLSDDGNRIAVNMAYAVANVGGKNPKSYTVRYKKSSESDSSYTQIGGGTETYAYSGTIKFTDYPAISTDDSYTVRIDVSDYFTTVWAECVIPSSFSLIDFRSTGKGIAFGKASEKDKFECFMPMELQGSPVSDFVIDHGTSGNWTYRKWKSGFKELFYSALSVNVSMTHAWGNVFESTQRFQLDFPEGFFSSWTREIITCNECDQGALSIEKGSGSGITHSAGFWLTSGTSVASATAYISAYIYGV